MDDPEAVPETVKSDIEDGAVLSIAGRVINIEPSNGHSNVLIEDRAGNDVLLTAFYDDVGPEPVEAGSWYVFRDAEGEHFRGQLQLNSNSGAMAIDPLSTAPSPLENTESQTSAADTGASGESLDGAPSDQQDVESVLAFDIETLTQVPESEFNFENPDHTEVLCIGLARAPAPGAPSDQTVLFRRGPSRADERRLLKAFRDQVEEIDPGRLVTYNGGFDQTHLIGRAERVAEEADLADWYRELFESPQYQDITRWTSLEDNADVPETYWTAYNHGLSPEQWRRDHPDWESDVPVDTPVVKNKDVPYFGDRYVALAQQDDRSEQEEQEYRALRELLRRYTATDVAKLPQLLAEDL